MNNVSQNTYPELYVFSSKNVVGIHRGESIIFPLIKSNHGANGTLSIPVGGMFLFDKEDQNMYLIEEVYTEHPFHHRVKIKPVNTEILPHIRNNRRYLIIPIQVAAN